MNEYINKQLIIHSPNGFSRAVIAKNETNYFLVNYQNSWATLGLGQIH